MLTEIQGRLVVIFLKKLCHDYLPQYFSKFPEQLIVWTRQSHEIQISNRQNLLVIFLLNLQIEQILKDDAISTMMLHQKFENVGRVKHWKIECPITKFTMSEFDSKTNCNFLDVFPTNFSLECMKSIYRYSYDIHCKADWTWKRVISLSLSSCNKIGMQDNNKLLKGGQMCD